MRTISFVLMAILSLSTWAQSNFTRDDFYKPGDSAQYFGVDATGISPGPAGNGVTWDFSNLSRKPDEDFKVDYALPSAAPNAGQFPEANMVAIQDAGATTAYSFLYADNNQIRLEGLDLPDLGVVTYTDKSEWFDLPFGFNESQSDPFVGTYTASVQGISVRSDRDGSLTTKYDGFGTVILPDGTRVNNVRRLKLDQTVNDKISVSGFTITTKAVTTTYHYFAEDERLQIFTILEGDVTVTPPGTNVKSVIAYYRVPSGTQQPVAANRRGPHLTTQGGAFNSEIIVRNPTDQAQSLNLIPLDGTGSPLATQTIQLGPNAISRTLQQNLFPAEAKSFEVNGCDDCIFSVGYRADIANASTAQVHQFGSFEKEVSIYPGEWQALFDGAAIVNAGDAAANITATQIDDTGNVINTVTLASNLAPGAKELVLFNDVLVDNPNSMIRINSEQPMAVMTLRISSDFRFLYQNLALPKQIDANAQRWLPHITSDSGGFNTSLVLHNRSNAEQTVTFTPYANDGSALSQVMQTVGAGQTMRLAKADLFDGNTSHLSISGSTDCIVSAGYRANSDGASTSISHEVSPTGKALYLYPGEWNVLFDGVAIINTGTETAQVFATQTSDDGTILAQGTLAELAPNAKYLGVFEGLFQDSPQSVIKIEATQDIALLTLRLSKDGRYLYNNNPQ